MPKTRYIEIKDTLRLKDQETVITRIRGERWRVDTSEPTVAPALQKRGHAPVGDDGVGHYLRFELPANALTFRSLFALEDSRQAENLPNGSTFGAGDTTKHTKGAEKSTQDRPFDDEDASSGAPTKPGPESGPKSPKGEEVTEDGSEASIMAKVSRSDGDSS